MIGIRRLAWLASLNLVTESTSVVKSNAAAPLENNHRF